MIKGDFLEERKSHILAISPLFINKEGAPCSQPIASTSLPINNSVHDTIMVLLFEMLFGALKPDYKYRMIPK